MYVNFIKQGSYSPTFLKIIQRLSQKHHVCLVILIMRVLCVHSKKVVFSQCFLDTLNLGHYMEMLGRDSLYPRDREAGGRKQWFWRSLVVKKNIVLLPENKPNL